MTTLFIILSISKELICASTTSTESSNICTPGKCTQCNYNGDKKKLYCTECLHSTLGGTEVDLTDGFCQGDSTGIDNCILTSRSNTTVYCARCALGYQFNPQGNCTTTTITDCVVTNNNKKYVWCLACGNNKHPVLPLKEACEVSDASVIIENCSAKDTFETCYICASGFGLSANRKSCIQGGGGTGYTCDS